MAVMTNDEAQTIITEMRDTAIQDSININKRIHDLRKDYEQDHWEETAAQITRLEARYERRCKEAAALAIAAVKYPEQ